MTHECANPATVVVRVGVYRFDSLTWVNDFLSKVKEAIFRAVGDKIMKMA